MMFNFLWFCDKSFWGVSQLGISSDSTSEPFKQLDRATKSWARDSCDLCHELDSHGQGNLSYIMDQKSKQIFFECFESYLKVYF